ncbi:MAG: hypothetical protein HZY79_12700 [Rhodoblastus sp.]|nr:MAG: hypothetical protein HZY79_12700 [Rhodoblastus sp.]
MRLGGDVGERAKRGRRGATVRHRDQPFALRLVDDAGRTRLPHHVIRHGVDEKRRPLVAFGRGRGLDGDERLDLGAAEAARLLDQGAQRAMSAAATPQATRRIKTALRATSLAAGSSA